MAYTIVGMFPNKEEARIAQNQLSNEGFHEENYRVSDYRHEGDLDEKYERNFEYEEDEKTTGFWDWLFGEDEDEKERYSYAGSRNNMITVYADNLEQANKARDIMNEVGAINVNEFYEDYFRKNQRTSTTDNDISEEKRARIIAKAKNNLYFTDETRNYKWRRGEGMTTDMDSMGNKDEN